MTQDIEYLRQEIAGLLQYLQRIRHEVSKINRSPGEDQKLARMSEQLDAIVHATEDATHTIMGKTESNDLAINSIRGMTDDPKILGMLDKMAGNNRDIFEACSFQDITGQRISRVLKSIRYVDTHINRIAEIWGIDKIRSEAVEPDTRTEDEKLLNGPALPGEDSIGQDEIDKLFT